MIDTIILTIPEGSFVMVDQDKFTSSVGARGFAKYIQNPTRADYLTGNYKPKLTKVVRAGGATLKIEFSVPKLLYGNNVDEVVEGDFPRIIETLSEKLKEMGVKIFISILENAPVSAVHFSKNIPLSDRYTSSAAIKELGKLDVTKRLEINNRHFQNDGHALYFDCGSYQIIFYDKLRDIKKNERQAVDKEKTSQQLELFQAYKDSKSNIELLRFEIRLTKKRLNSLLASLGFSINPTFVDIFKEKVAKDFLLHYWNIISSDKTRFVLTQDEELEKMLDDIISYYKKGYTKPQIRTVLAVFGLIIFTKKYGIRPLRNIIDSNFSDRTWFRQSNNLLTQTSEIASTKRPFGFVTDIERTLDKFQPYRTIQLKGEQS